MPPNDIVSDLQLRQSLIETSRLAQVCFDGAPGTEFLDLLRAEAGAGDVVLPGQFTAQPRLFPDSDKKSEVTAIDLAIREGRRQMVNLIQYLIDAEAMILAEEARQEQTRKAIDAGLERNDPGL